MDAWDGFLTAELGASAALLGLVFVALSINLTRILSVQGLSARAGEACLVLGAVMIGTSLLLVPGQGPRLAGAEIGAVGLGTWAALIVLHRGRLRASSAAAGRAATLLGMALGQASAIPFVIAGALLAARGDFAGAGWIAPGVVLSVLDAFVTSWILLVEINR